MNYRLHPCQASKLPPTGFLSSELRNPQNPQPPEMHIFLQVPYRLSPLFATLTKIAGVYPPSSHSETRPLPLFLCKFAPFFSVTSTMPRPQSFSFHTFALLPGGVHPPQRNILGVRFAPSLKGRVDAAFTPLTGRWSFGNLGQRKKRTTILRTHKRKKEGPG